MAATITAVQASNHPATATATVPASVYDYDCDDGSRNTSTTAVPLTQFQHRASHLSLKPPPPLQLPKSSPSQSLGTLNDAVLADTEGQRNSEATAGAEAEAGAGVAYSGSAKVFKNLWHEIAFLVLVTSSQLITQANLGNTIMPGAAVARGLGAPPGADTTLSQTWFIASYSCTVGAFVLVTGRLGDLYGRKYIFLLGWAWLAVCNIAAGFSPSQIPFDVFRALAGIGPSMLMPNASALLAAAWPDPRRPRDRKMKQLAFTVFGAIAPGGYIVGTAWGSAITQLGASWRWVYWSMAIGAAVLGLAAALIVPGSRGFNGRGRGGFDFLGSVLGVAGLVLVFVSLNGGPAFGWHTAWVPVLLVLGLLSLAAFAWAEHRALHPILPLGIFRSPTFAAVAVSLCLGWMSFGMFQYYTPLFLQRFRAQSPLGTVLQMLPTALTGVVAAILAVILLPRVPGYTIFGASMLCFFIGQLLLALTPVSQSYWRMTFPTTLVITFGPDLSFACASLIASDLLPPDQQGVAGSFINTVVNYSVALGLALAGNVETGTNEGGADLLKGYRAAWWLGAGFAALGGVMTAVFYKGMGARHKVD